MGIQNLKTGKAIEYGIRIPSSDFDKRANKSDGNAVYLTKAGSSAKSGGFVTQKKGIKGQTGKNSFGKIKSGTTYGKKVKAVKGDGTQKRGFGGQTRGR